MHRRKSTQRVRLPLEAGEKKIDSSSNTGKGTEFSPPKRVDMDAARTKARAHAGARAEGVPVRRRTF